MKRWVTLGVRILLGLLFFASGVAGLVMEPPPMDQFPPDLRAFNEGMAAARYFMPFLKITEIVCGVLLLSGFFVPLALVVLAPIVLNIVFVHAFMDPTTIAPGIIAGVMLAYLSFFADPYRQVIFSLFRPKEVADKKITMAQ